MRLLFVSDITMGGSGRSQRDLARALERRGHEVLVLADRGAPAHLTRWSYEQLSDAAERFKGSTVGRALARVGRRPGRHYGDLRLDGVAHLTSPVVQNAADALIRSYRPEVVIGSSISRLGWRQICAVCDHLAIPTVLYVRETSALRHIEVGRAADLVIANSAPLAAQVRAVGLPCEYLPSLVDVEPTRVESTRTTVLSINPVAERGSATVWALAERLEEVPFVVQESWPLDPVQLAEVERHVARLPNVELRRARSPGPHLYRDARVLLVPYRDADRPRVILEAQANSIPVVAGDLPALQEAIGPGGRCVPLDDLDAWEDALSVLWRDVDAYRQLAAAAGEHSRRVQASAEHITNRFEHLLFGLCRPG